MKYGWNCYNVGFSPVRGMTGALLLAMLASGCTTNVEILFQDTSIDAGSIDADPPFADDGGSEVDAGSSGGCDASGSCICVAGSKRCDPDDPKSEILCVVVAGNTVEKKNACSQGAFCLKDTGCTACPEDCTLGKVTCNADATKVLQCVESATGCHATVELLDCPTNGLASCVPPPPGTNIPAEMWCVNECGGRGVPLANKLCDQGVVAPLCAFLVCDPATFLLVPDHEACLGGGQTCTSNEQCKSCACIGGICLGSTPKSCSALCQ